MAPAAGVAFLELGVGREAAVTGTKQVFGLIFDSPDAGPAVLLELVRHFAAVVNLEAPDAVFVGEQDHGKNPVGVTLVEVEFGVLGGEHEARRLGGHVVQGLALDGGKNPD